MSAADFFDTHVLVYMVDRRDPVKQAIAQPLVSHAITSNSGAISGGPMAAALEAACRHAPLSPYPSNT